MGLGEWNFCLKLLSVPTKTLLLLFEGFEGHTHAECWAKNNEHSIHLPHFNAIILYFI